jgi:hypothetical protein
MSRPSLICSWVAFVATGSRTKYRRFASAAEAIRYAVEDLRTPRAFGAWLQVGNRYSRGIVWF